LYPNSSFCFTFWAPHMGPGLTAGGTSALRPLARPRKFLGMDPSFRFRTSSDSNRGYAYNQVNNMLIFGCILWCRFCIGDRYYLCENKILCQFDYEERLVFASLQSQETYAATISKHSTAAKVLCCFLFIYLLCSGV